jgi:hypothetical protein
MFCGVKMRRTRIEHILSALPPLATEERTFGIGSSVPQAPVSSSSNRAHSIISSAVADAPTYSHHPFDEDTFLMQNSSQGRPAASPASLLRLNLHRLAQLRRGARSDNEIPLRRCAGALRDLPDGADCIDDGGAGRIRHEPSERF